MDVCQGNWEEIEGGWKMKRGREEEEKEEEDEEGQSGGGEE